MQKRKDLEEVMGEFWKAEGARGLVAGAHFREQESSYRSQRKRRREDEEADDELPKTRKRRRLNPSLTALHPPCIQRSYHAHERTPSIAQTNAEVTEVRPKLMGTPAKGTPERLRRPPSPASSLAQQNTDKTLPGEGQRQGVAKRDYHAEAHKELVDAKENQPISRIPLKKPVQPCANKQLSTDFRAQGEQQPWVISNTWSADRKWPFVSPLDGQIKDCVSREAIMIMDLIDKFEVKTGEALTGTSTSVDSQTQELFESTFSTNYATECIVEASRVETSLEEAGEYCRRRIEAARPFIMECKGYLYSRLHNDEYVASNLLDLSCFFDDFIWRLEGQP